jgi:stringent starvation protein B
VVNASFAGVKVPDEFIEDGQIILNVSPQAVSHLEMGNELISFSARFRGLARSVEVPVDAVLAVFDRETRQGMSFPGVTDDEDVADDAADSQPPARGKPKLKLVE